MSWRNRIWVCGQDSGAKGEGMVVYSWEHVNELPDFTKAERLLII
jgi:hypothetical protein